MPGLLVGTSTSLLFSLVHMSVCVCACMCVFLLKGDEKVYSQQNGIRGLAKHTRGQRGIGGPSEHWLSKEVLN